MTLRQALLAATILTLPAGAGAQPMNGLYLGAGGGVNFVPDETSNGIRLSTKDVGSAAVLSLG